MAKIINLRLTNLLGLKSADLEPNGKSLTIGGKNGNGKSSLQNAMKMILGGKDFMPAEPVHRGEEKGEGFIELDDGHLVNYSVEGRAAKLKIKHKDNPLFSTDSVTFLRSLFGNLTFDPGEVLAKGPRALADSLRVLCGLDFTQLDQRRASAYEERTAIGRDVKRLEGQIAGLTFHKDTPALEEASQAILAEIQTAQEVLADHTRHLDQVSRCADLTRKELQSDAEIVKEIERLEAKRVAIQNTVQNFAEMAREAEASAAALTVIDVAPLKERLANVEATNRKVRENKQFRQVQSDLEGFRTEYLARTQEIEAIDKEKSDTLVAAEMPIDGLTLADDGLRYQGTLWDALSESEQWEVATAIAFAQNPQGVVFISRSGGLDIDTRRRVMERAEKLGVQAFLEVVDDAPDVLVVIERGEVKENRLEHGAAA